MERQESYETINVTRDGGAMRIELNRPDSMNALTPAVAADLLAALSVAEVADDVRVVVLFGAGKGFSSGADLKAGFEARPDGRPDVGKVLRDFYHPVLLKLRELPKPVVAAVHGPAVGVGCSLALCCDLVVAREDAYFLLAFVNIGLVADGGSSAYLPAKIGLARATEMAMLGERIGAERALEWGMINAVHDAGSFDAAVRELEQRLAKGPTQSYAGTKRQLNRWAYTQLADQLEYECTIQEEMAGTSDFLEGVGAFIQKRPAAFTGT